MADQFSVSMVLGSSHEECGLVWARGAQASFHATDILLADADEVQRITKLRPSVVTFTVYWSRSALEREARELGLPGVTRWAVSRLTSRALSSTLTTLRELLVSGGDAESVAAAYRSATAQLLRGAGQTSLSAETRGPRHPGVRRAVKRLRTGLSEPLLLEELGLELNMSKCHLVRCFQQSLGVPPHRYRRLVRLQYARRLLEGGHSVSEAALETGFADAPHLSRDFRDWLGVSPAAWRKAWRAGNPWSAQPPRTMPPPMLPLSDYKPPALASDPSARR